MNVNTQLNINYLFYYLLLDQILAMLCIDTRVLLKVVTLTDCIISERLLQSTTDDIRDWKAVPLLVILNLMQVRCNAINPLTHGEGLCTPSWVFCSLLKRIFSIFIFKYSQKDSVRK